MKDKLYAFGIHFCISAVVAGIFAIFVYQVWYERPLDIATGVSTVFLMMVCIDVVLGPLLTFIVYKKGKKTLKFDLSVIVLLQSVALFYGGYNIINTRPVWIALDQGVFYLVRANEIDLNNQKQAVSDYRYQTFWRPHWISIQRPDKNTEQAKELLFYDLLGANLAVTKPKYYRNLVPDNIKNSNGIKPLVELNKFNEFYYVEDILSKYPDANAFIPLETRNLDQVVLINKEKGEVVKIVDLRPWK